MSLKYKDENGVWQGIVGSSDVVRYEPQTLTVGQKDQARTNIGAISAADAVGRVYEATTDELNDMTDDQLAAIYQQGYRQIKETKSGGFSFYGLDNNGAKSRLWIPKPELLWSNASQNSNFGEQALAIPQIANYHFLIIRFLYSISYNISSDGDYNAMWWDMFPSQNGAGNAGHTWADNINAVTVSRFVNPSGSEVQFGRGLITRNGTTHGIDDSYAVPLQIWGY